MDLLYTAGVNVLLLCHSVRRVSVMVQLLGWRVEVDLNL